ncbi:MAG: DUF2271 domain-containing protein [Bacteroidia bacterium]|nr:DUF2271 domain-containing protein [Bacteroidia bacterium]
MYKFSYLMIAILAMFIAKQSSAQTFTEGLVTFQVTTVSNGGTYAPRHVLAIWIKDGAGNFVKSRKVMAATRKQHLVKWMASSGNNSTDAVTGATLTQHTSHTVTWDCRNLQGNIVPDGTYEVWIEYTSQNSANTGVAGPFYSYSFSKGTSPLNVTIPDQTYFKNMSLTYNTSAVDIPEQSENKEVALNIHAEGSDLIINFELPEKTPVHLALYDLSGRRLQEICDSQLDAGKHTFRAKAPSVSEGVAIIRLWTPTGISSKKWSGLAH